MKLPYPGHTWSFTQHAVGLDPKTLYNFLKSASAYEGDANCSSEINKVMGRLRIFTENRRDDKPDAWRDYQQILAELGLMYSTKLTNGVIVFTELGHRFLAGDIGFSELIGIQALRYQYPNGQKSTIQSRLKTEFSSSGLSTPQTLTELQSKAGVLLKPGTLILRILIELNRSKLGNFLTVDECQNYLIPCKSNSDWIDAFNNIVNSRSASDQKINNHAKRNVRDWFKFLSNSDFFDLPNNSTLSLSSYSLSAFEDIDSYCSNQESRSSYWIPSDFDIQGRKSWFEWFGSFDSNAQKMIRVDNINDDAYFAENYINSSINDEVNDVAEESLSVNLKDLSLDSLNRDPNFNFSTDIDILIENLLKGAEKRHSKTVLHDKIVQRLAIKFQNQGAKIMSDPKTIDLFALWPDGSSAIFEVKTVTRKNLQSRIRLAVGQISEYDYRQVSSTDTKSEKVIVVNSIIDESSWQKSFLTDYMNIGLICITTSEYKAYSPNNYLSSKYWGEK